MYKLKPCLYCINELNQGAVRKQDLILQPTSDREVRKIKKALALSLSQIMESLLKCYRRHLEEFRDYFINKRFKTFCFIYKNVSWYSGLRLIALMTIAFGIFDFVVINAIILRSSPARVQSYIIFPGFALIAISEVLIYLAMGTQLWIGVQFGKLHYIKSFPWFILVGYIYAILYTLLTIQDGEFVIQSIVWSDHGMQIKSQPKIEKKFIIIQRAIFYAVMAFLILTLISFTTYIMILSMSWIDKLEIELEEEE